MKFCPICPTSGLYTYAVRFDHHMVLAQVFMEDAIYRKFYLEQRALGSFIILDNGAYEGALDTKWFRAALAQLKPQVAVLPDIVMGEGEVSYSLGRQFYNSWASYFPETSWLYIPHGKDIFDWCYGLSLFTRYYEEGVRWIGIPRCLATHILPEEYIRVDAANYINRIWPNVNIHAMGMVRGDVDELHALSTIPTVRTIDSAAPIWRGAHGLYTRTMVKDIGHLDFKFEIPEQYHEQINQNLEECIA